MTLAEPLCEYVTSYPKVEPVTEAISKRKYFALAYRKSDGVADNP